MYAYHVSKRVFVLERWLFKGFKVYVDYWDKNGMYTMVGTFPNMKLAMIMAKAMVKEFPPDE